MATPAPRPRTLLSFLFRFVCACAVVSALAFGPAGGLLVAQDASPTSENYVIRVQDGLIFRIVGEPETETEVRVDGDGRISLPFVGTIDVAGRTVQQVRTLLFELYDRDYFVNPQIQLIVNFYAERRVQVLGEVNRPGFVVIPPEEQMTLLQAIAGAGGFTRLANQREIQIKRVAPDGSAEIFRVNVADVLRGASSSDVPVLKGDTIFVPERVF